jgi:hypothetical protein
MFGLDDRLPLDSDETRLLRSPRALMIGGGTAAVLLLGMLWLITRPKPDDSASQTRISVVEVSPVPSRQTPQPSPLPTAQIQPTAEGLIVDVSPTPAPNIDPSSEPPAQFQLDPRLIGTWETKGRWQPNSSRVRTARWTVETDGHFVFSGPWSDAGAITAAEGTMKWFSNSVSQPVDITYEFNGDVLITHGPLGEGHWIRAKRSSEQSNRSSQRERTRKSTVPDDQAKREMFRRMFDRFRR